MSKDIVWRSKERAIIDIIVSLDDCHTIGDLVLRESDALLKMCKDKMCLELRRLNRRAERGWISPVECSWGNTPKAEVIQTSD